MYSEYLKNVPILILYGGDDWCPRSHAEDVQNYFFINQLQNLLPESVEIDIVSDSGHLIYTDNYEELSDKIIAYLKTNKEVTKKIYEENLIGDTTVFSNDLSSSNCNNLKSQIEKQIISYYLRQ